VRNLLDNEKNKQKFRNIGLKHLIVIIFFIIVAFLPIPPGGGYMLFVYGGWQGLFFIFLSIIFAFFTRVNKAIVSGALGCIGIGINLIIGDAFFGSADVVLLPLFVGFYLVTINLYLYKLMELKDTLTYSVIQEKYKRIFRRIGLIHLIFLIIFILTVFYGVAPYSFFYLILLWSSPLFIFLSILFAQLLKVNSSIVFGILGCILLIITTGILRFYYMFPIQITWCGYIVVTISLYKFRPTKKEIKAVPEKLQPITPMEKEIKAVPEKLQPITEEQQQEQLQQQRLAKLATIVRVSRRLEVSRMAEVLKMKESDLWDFIFDWAEEFNFKIDKDIIEFDVDKTDDFIATLDSEFKKWEKSTEKL